MEGVKSGRADHAQVRVRRIEMARQGGAMSPSAKGWDGTSGLIVGAPSPI